MMAVAPSGSIADGRSTPEYLTLRKSFTMVVTHFKTQTGEVCDALFEKGYIPLTVCDYVRTDKIQSENKAQKLLDTLLGKVELDPSVFHGFISILKTERPSADFLTAKLEERFKSEKAALAKGPAIMDQKKTTPTSRFICPFCQNCTVAKFFSEDGCPLATQKSEKESLFPYLDYSTLNEKDKISLETQLLKDTKEMIKIFADTEDSLITSLESQNISVSRFRSYAKNFMRKIGTKDDLERLDNSKDLYDVAYALKPFLSFFHHEILLYIAQKFGNGEDQQLMEEYKSKFFNFCKRKVFEVPPNIFHDCDPKPNDKMFSVKFTPDEYPSLGDVVDVRARLADILNIEVYALRLCCITKGCVCLRFLVSAQKAKIIFPLSQSQMSALEDIHVRILESPVSQQYPVEVEETPRIDEMMHTIENKPLINLSKAATDMATDQQHSPVSVDAPITKDSSLTHQIVQNTRLKDGLLYKRRRGQRAHDLRGLKFQQRYCVLSSETLSYYSKKDKELDNKPNGSLLVAKMRIIEKVPEKTFKKKYCFQVGDEKEVVYFSASSETERYKWMEILRTAAFQLREGQSLPNYHTGAFGKLEKNLWSCCNQVGREAQGCELSTIITEPELNVATHKNIIDGAPSEESIPSTLYTEKQDSDSEEYSGEEEPDYLLPISEEAHPMTWPSSQSLFNSGRGNSVYDLCKVHMSPAPHRPSAIRIMQSFSPSDDKLELTFSPFKFAQKTIISSGEGYITLMHYKSADSLIIATNTGKVFLITSMNTPKPRKQVIFTNTDKNSVTMGVWGKYFVVGSSKLFFGSLEDPSVLKCSEDSFDTSQDDSQSLLASLGPDGSLFFASKNSNSVNMIKNTAQNNWLSLTDSSKITTSFDLSGQVFRLAVSPHSNEPWLAVGFTSSNNEVTTDFVSVFNYKSTKCCNPDIEIAGQGSVLNLVFTHNGQYLYVGSGYKIQCFYSNTLKPADFNYTFKEKNDSITSMYCSVCHHLAVGMKSGTVRVFMGDPSQPATAPYIITDTKINGAVTSLSYSSDGRDLAVAFQDESILICKESAPPEEQPLTLTRTGTLVVTDKGQTYHSTEDDYTITIPEGAVEPGTVVRLDYGVAPDSPYGPYEFKDGARPVSAIISLCPEPANTEFLKPIEVTLTHFIAYKSPQKLHFYGAQHNRFRVENGNKIYHFEKITDGFANHFSQYNTQFSASQGAATLYTTHCPYSLCIAKQHSEESTLKELLCLMQIIPKHPNLSQEYKVYYCLFYFLDTCAQVVDEQFPNDQYDKERLVVFFETEAKVLQIQIGSGKLKGAWLLHTHPEQSQIMKQDLCIRNNLVQYKIDESINSRRCPPKIPLYIQPGEKVEEGVVTTVSFSGVREHQGGTAEFTLELVKPYQTAGANYEFYFPTARTWSHSTSTTSYHSTTSSVIKSPKEAINKFQEDFDEIANSINSRRLASALFSASSQTKCPYLDESSIELTRSFLEKARSSSSDNFSTNFTILHDAYSIADRHPQYITAIQAALSSALPDTLKNQLGYHSASQLSFDDPNILSPVPTKLPRIDQPDGGSCDSPI